MLSTVVFFRFGRGSFSDSQQLISANTIACWPFLRYNFPYIIFVYCMLNFISDKLYLITLSLVRDQSHLKRDIPFSWIPFLSITLLLYPK